ncbi:MAG TPA: FkbM family methyltransferase, partial [Verrucomicrobiae bacterium]|nr:FkbM family methyltransferase [Verrucomicrobiae bacterium]
HGLAAGVPVITWEIPNRPLTRALYEPGKEILLYSADQPAQLADHIQRVQRDPVFATTLAANGLRRMRSEHTTEGFVSSFMNWIGGGTAARPGKSQSNTGNSTSEAFQVFASGDLVFDIGANVGAKAERFAAEGAKVICFEPQPNCVATLRNKFTGRSSITVVSAGLAAAKGNLELSICSAANTISTFSSEWKQGRFSDYRWDEKVTVPVMTLDEAIQTYGRPRYAKIDVEGFELEVLRGLSQIVPVVSFEYTAEFLNRAAECLSRLVSLGYRNFNATVGEKMDFVMPGWSTAEQLLAGLKSSSDSTLWGDIYAWCEDVTSENEVPSTNGVLAEIKSRGLWSEGRPLRLHLGCGEQRFDGYVNVDYPPSEHNVMTVKADVFTNILTMEMPAGSVDEVRLHHVFEHFNRVTALAMLIKWQRWLKTGGVLRIETPDLMGSARTLLSNAPLRVKMGVVRHLAGDQAASWAYHLEHWFPERYVHTLETLGFANVQTRSNTWATEPYLSNVEVLATKVLSTNGEDLLQRADALLRESMVAPAEQPTWEVWRQQLREALAGKVQPAPINIPANKPVVTSKSDPSPVPAQPAAKPASGRDLHLGLKLYGHDAAVFSIFPDEKDLFGIAEERITRYKHDDLFPIDAIRRLIAHKNIDPNAVENVYAGSAFVCQKNEPLPARYYERTVALRRFFRARYTKEFQTAAKEFFTLSSEEQVSRLQADEHGRKYLRLLSLPGQTLHAQFQTYLRELFPNAAIHLDYHDHEYCHAVSAYYSSGFDRALVVAFDGWGDA